MQSTRFLSTRPTVGGPHSDSTDVGETTGGYTADLLAPERIQASFIYKRVDALRFPAMDPSLRMALNGGLEEKLDYEVIAGDDGLLTGANLPNNKRRRGDDVRGLHLQIRICARGWAVRGRAGRSQDRRGRRYLRAYGFGLPQQ